MPNLTQNSLLHFCILHISLNEHSNTWKGESNPSIITLTPPDFTLPCPTFESKTWPLDENSIFKRKMRESDQSTAILIRRRDEELESFQIKTRNTNQESKSATLRTKATTNATKSRTYDNESSYKTRKSPLWKINKNQEPPLALLTQISEKSQSPPVTAVCTGISKKISKARCLWTETRQFKNRTQISISEMTHLGLASWILETKG